MSLDCSPIFPRRSLGWKRAASICQPGCGISFSPVTETGTGSVPEKAGDDLLPTSRLVAARFLGAPPDIRMSAGVLSFLPEGRPPDRAGVLKTAP